MKKIGERIARLALMPLLLPIWVVAQVLQKFLRRKSAVTGVAYSGLRSLQPSESDLEFLQAILSAEVEGGKDAVYPLFVQNLERLTPRFGELLIAWAESVLQEQPEAAVEIDALMTNLCTRFQEFPLGNRADNFEIAIAGYTFTATVITKEINSVDWATTKNNLANAYSARIRGDRAENLELSIASYLEALEIRTRQDFPVDWAQTKNNLAAAYSARIRGDRAENLELSIASYLEALEIRTRQDFPVDWAQTKNNLANAYSARIRGDRAENLELSIASYLEALEISTRQDFPVDWAQTKNNLANAYSARIRGDRAENLELSIASYLEALEIRTRQDFPVAWATTKNNLANAYSDRIRGDRAENLELSIASYLEALEISTRQDFPVDWAQTKNNLATAYSDRIRGDRAENLELSIASYLEALEISTRQDFPVDWAQTKNNLANAYSARIRGDRAENLELSIASYLEALEIRTRQDFPVDWAQTKNNLANAYSARIRGDRAENLELSIASYLEALEIRTRQDFPVAWATTKNNLANAYSARIRGDRAENLELSIASYLEALEIRTRQDFPVDWAQTKNNLANAYSARIRGDRAENLELSIAAYQDALQVYLPELMPEFAAKTANNLGNTGFTAGNWPIAIKGYSIAIAAYETTRNWGSSESRRLEVQEGAIGTYEKLIQACINADNLPLALTTVERSRSKRLVDLMLTNDLYSNGQIPAAVQSLLANDRQIQTEISTYQQENAAIELAGTRGGRDPRAKTQNNEAIAELEQQRQQLRDDLSRLDPIAVELLQVKIPDLASLQTLVTSPTIALLSFYSTSVATHIFVLKQDSLSCHTCEGQDMAELNNWLADRWLKPYLLKDMQKASAGDSDLAELLQSGRTDELLQSDELPEEVKEFVQPLSGSKNWSEQMPATLAELGKRLDFDRLITNHLTNIEELILVPHRYLHQIPFAALPTHTGLLGDQFRLRQVPSTQVLDFCQTRPTLTTTTHGTVEDATNDLPGARYEGQQIAQIYNIPDDRRLRGNQATVENYRTLLPQITHLLSSHHAYSRLDNPLESRLQLADGSLSLADLLTPGFHLPYLSDVFLSCCETGLSFSQARSDDPITLATGFLCAGARNVVSTLWAVDDIATALFSIRYHHHRQTHDRPTALQKAQQDLRTLSGPDFAQQHRSKLHPILQTHYKTCGQKVYELKQSQKNASPEVQVAIADEITKWNLVATQAKDGLDRLESLGKIEFPFADPIYWAGFICQGIA